MIAVESLKPLDDRVVVMQLKAEETSRGGIVIPDTAQEKPQKGTVLSVGPGKRLESGERAPVSVKVGDTVLFAKWAGNNSKSSIDENVLIMAESEILAVIEK